MKLSFYVTGKTKEDYLLRGIDEYRKRVEKYYPFVYQEIPDIKTTKGMSDQAVRDAEGEQIMKRIKPTDYLVLLDEKGRSFRSLTFAHYLLQMESRVGQMVFLVGGPYGFSEKIYQRANEKIALSEMTFPHQLVRLIFLEQLYRACTINRNEPYHHE